ncbi:hypothetical protein WA026_018751 [Henosepilachna vigintioctopunctata]|uniref:Uncharacterized protein n=1 Tax=Henosepilachna vigintioctopunctata TaxID=420089 RepID=A0AAW1TW73_9CUCU
MHKMEKAEDKKVKLSVNLKDRRFITQDNLDKKCGATYSEMECERRSSIPLGDGYQSDKSHISIENDTESCLDYEPYQDEVEGYMDFPEELESRFESEGSQLRYEEAKEVQKSEDTKNIDIKNKFGMNSCGSRRSNNGSNILDDIVITDTDYEQNDDGWNEQGTVNDEANFSGGSCFQQKNSANDFVMNYSETQDSKNCLTSFKNAAVNFNGPFNITISRPVNKSECLNINHKDSLINDKTGPVNSNTDIKNLRTESYSTSEISSQKVLWSKQKLDLHLVMIKSNDDIFNYNLKEACSLSNQSEVLSSIFDLGFLSEATENNCKMRKVSNLSSQGDVCSDRRINDCYNDPSSGNSVVIQSVVVIPPNIDNCQIPAVTSMNLLKGSHDNKLTDNEKNKICSGQRPTSSISRSSSVVLSRQDNTLKNCLKQHHSRDPRLNRPPTLCEEDALSILGSSSILEQISNLSEASEILSNENDKEEFVNRWLTSSSETDIYGIVESLCESYFTSNCENSECEKLHSVDEQRIKALSSIQLNELYAHARNKMFWFTVTFDIFLDCFKAFAENGRMCLVDMINDVFEVFNGTFIDKTSYISKIVAALQSTGFSFKETIEYIILRYGTSQISICDILLLIISKQSCLELEDHWCLVEKIICCRREKLDHDMVINLLNSFLSKYPPDLILCKKVYDEILKKNLVDLDKIPDSLCRNIRIALKIYRKRKSQSDLREFNDWSSNSSYSILDKKLRKSPTHFQREYRERYVDNVQIKPFNSDTSRRCSPVISEFSMSKLRMQNKQERLYDLNENKDINYFNSECSQVIHPLINTPVNKYDTMAQHDSNMHNKTAISVESRSQIHSGNCRDNANIESRELRDCSNKVNYCCNHKRSIDQELFKTSFDMEIKKKTYGLNSRNIEYVASEKFHSKVKKSSKSFCNDEVLNNINGTLNAYARASTPDSSIAHPSAQPFISSSYKCNVSLHNLYPDMREKNIELTKLELLQLRDALDKMNGVKFLKLLENSSNAFTIENFVLNSLILIKSSTNTSYICEKFLSLVNVLEDLEINSLKISYIKLTVEVLAMNLVYFLERKGEWSLCKDILLRIKMKNWHSLVTSKIFFCKNHLMSHMSRYIYISEILIRAGDFHWANEIFQLNTLSLLGPMVKWPYQKVPSDLKLRNDVLKLFFEQGFLVNIVVVNDLLNHINIVNSGKIEGLQIWKLFDEKLCMILDFEEEYKSILLYLSTYIASYGQYMAKNVLWGYMLFIKDFLDYKQSFELFKLCCEKGIYHKYTGNERVIIITTNMCDFEINSILWCFFQNILKRHISPHDFHIDLKLPDFNQPNKPNILKNRLNRNIFAVHASIIKTLKLKYSIIVQDTIEYTIFVTESMQQFLPWI